MLQVKKFTLGLVLAVLFVVFAAPQVSADLTKAEEREVNNYQLTEKKLGQFAQATKNLVAVVQKNPQIFQTPGTESEEGDLSLAEVTDKIPEVKKAIQDAGMTSREYWIFQIAMAYGAAGHLAVKAGGKLPEGFSKSNAEFFGKHEAAFMALDNDLKIIREISEREGESEEDEEDDDEDEEEEDDDDQEEQE